MGPKAKELTMYGYSAPRETKKISLGLGDRNREALRLIGKRL